MFGLDFLGDLADQATETAGQVGDSIEAAGTVAGDWTATFGGSAGGTPVVTPQPDMAGKSLAATGTPASNIATPSWLEKLAVKVGLPIWSLAVIGVGTVVLGLCLLFRKRR